jgi:hypothetical protein
MRDDAPLIGTALKGFKHGVDVLRHDGEGPSLAYNPENLRQVDIFDATN